MMTGSHSSGWPPGAAQAVQLELTLILRQWAMIATSEERQVLVEVGLAVEERAAANRR